MSLGAINYVRETELYYLQSRYYDPEVGRFLNADALASTGQGVLGNNMFAYCNNNPVNCADSFGLRPVSILERFGDNSIPVPPKKGGNGKANNKEPSAQSENVMEKWRKKGVTYKSNGAGKGGRINNSYLIKNYEDMYAYSEYLVNESEYRNDFTGSVEGVVFEWDIHNIIYYYGPSQWEDNAKDVDFGRTIFSDSHKGLNVVMWLGFYLTYPDQYYSDLFS